MKGWPRNLIRRVRSIERLKRLEVTGQIRENLLREGLLRSPRCYTRAQTARTPDLPETQIVTNPPAGVPQVAVGGVPETWLRGAVNWQLSEKIKRQP